MVTLGFVLATIVLLGIVALLGWRGIREDNPVLAINAAVSLMAPLIPLSLAVAGWLGAIDVTIGPALPLWLAMAGCIHTVGMTGVYERIWWWDHLAHVVSSALIAALVYAGVLVIADDAANGSLSQIVTVTVALTMGAGLLWELIELVGRDIASLFGADPLLVPYGKRDTALDLLFDLVGALLIVGGDLRTFVPLASRHEDLVGAALVAMGILVVAGSVLLFFAWIMLGRYRGGPAIRG